MTWAGRRGAPPPEALRRRPRLAKRQKEILDAFSELSSARPYIGMAGAAGPIPSPAIDAYALRRGFADPLVYDRFVYLIRALDGLYVSRINKKLEQAGGGGNKPGRGRRSGRR